MKNSDYQIIVDSITDQISKCERALSVYNACSQDFSKMTIEDINTTILDCRKVQQTSDKLVRDDLYHIIGMANLNAAQASKIVKLTKTLLQYRSDVKFFAYQNTVQVPKRKESVYKLSSGLKLVNKKGD